MPSSFLDLPPELRLKVYAYMSSACTHPSIYSGLRRTCRTIRQEFDHEVQQRIQLEYREHAAFLAGFGIRILSPLPYTLQTSNIALEFSAATFEPSASVQLPVYLVPWHWPWIKHAVISVNTADMSALALRNAASNLMLIMAHMLWTLEPWNTHTAWQFASLPEETVTGVTSVYVRYDNIPRRLRGVGPRTWSARFEQYLDDVARFWMVWRGQVVWDRKGRLPKGRLFTRRSRLDYLVGAVGYFICLACSWVDRFLVVAVRFGMLVVCLMVVVFHCVIFYHKFQTT